MEQIKTGQVKTLAGQFIRFGIVGGLNTAIDFGVLNLLSFITGITKGTGLVPLNMISFTVAVINSYYLNKYWAFKDQSSGEGMKKFSLFLVISVIGALINTGTVTLVATSLEPWFGLGPTPWLNVAKVLATGLSLIWNFIGYKLLVFKK